MRILLISTDALPTPPPRYGGNERVVALLATALGRAGHAVTVVARDDSPEGDGYTVARLPAGTDPLTAWPDAWWRQWDVVHDHGWRLVSWRLAARHPDRRWWMTWHGPRIDDVVGWFPPVPPNLRIAGLTPSHALALAASLDVPVAVTPNAVDLGAYPLQAGPRSLPPLVLARIDPAKGQHLARWLARQAGRDLLLAGTEHLGPDPAYVQALLTRADGHRVEWLGDLGDEAKRWYLSQTQAVLWPAWGYEEPFGLGVLEALAVGTPVLALARGGIPDLLGRNSPMIRTSLADLADALHQWDRTLRALPDPRACRGIAGQWSVRRMLAAYETFWAAG